ncbi:hypothetical protein TNCV_3920781 [Trichonephila clavipes]|nr:hypothetical protein TNCV_3920781 [Trichonephila clavipes]
MAEVKVVEDEDKVVTARFNGEVVMENKKCSAVQLKMSNLKIVKISYGGAEYETVVDSGESTITEYDEDNGNNTKNFKKQQQICDTPKEAWNFAKQNKGGYVIENDIL